MKGKEFILYFLSLRFERFRVESTDNANMSVPNFFKWASTFVKDIKHASILILQISGSVTRKLFRRGRKIFIFLAYPSLSLSVHAEQHREEGRVVALAGLVMAHSLKNSLAQRLLYR